MASSVSSFPTSSNLPARRRAWLVPAGLLALSAAPTLFGIARMAGLVLGRETLPDHARMAAHPVPVALHIVGATGFALLGALQFLPPHARLRAHRFAGRLAVPLGIVGALAAMWLSSMVQTSVDDAPWLRVPRFTAAAAMLVCLVVAWRAVMQRDLASHVAWMKRGYALALGSGTQFITLAPYMMLVPQKSPTVGALLLVLGWVINLAVAELSIRRARRPAR